LTSIAAVTASTPPLGFVQRDVVKTKPEQPDGGDRTEVARGRERLATDRGDHAEDGGADQQPAECSAPGESA
jgi:hypothetical protein